MGIKNNSMDQYQSEVVSMAIYPNAGHNFVYPALGLAGEAGEVSEKIKKLIRDDDSIVTDRKREELKEELGDVLWYVAAVAAEFQLSLSDIADANIEKLRLRKKRGTFHGSGNR